MAAKKESPNVSLYDVEHTRHHGAKPGFAARGLALDVAEKYSEEMAAAHPGHAYRVVQHDPRA